MNRIEKYQNKKAELSQIKISELNKIDIGRLLACDIWHEMDLSIWQVLLRIFIQLFFKRISISPFPDSNIESNFLAVEIQINKEIRKDREQIFNNAYAYVKPSSHIYVHKGYWMDIRGIPKRISLLRKYLKLLNKFSVKERSFYALQLIMAVDILKQLKRKRIFKDISYMLIYHEDDTISNLLIQKAQMSRIKVVSLQHGAPMNRKFDIDHLIFDNFLCNYKLLWNEFSKKQFISAGIDENKLIVVGNTKTMDDKLRKPIFERDDTVFGIVLDGPQISYSSEYNHKLLSIADDFAKENKLKYIIKLHPLDNKKPYEKYKGRGYCKTILSPITTIDEYSKKISFTLAHTTGASVDLIMINNPVFLFQTDIPYPVITDDIYKFKTKNELNQKYRKWKSDDSYRDTYYKIAELYFTDNATKRHQEFFDHLLTGDKKGIKNK